MEGWADGETKTAGGERRASGKKEGEKNEGMQGRKRKVKSKEKLRAVAGGVIEGMKRGGKDEEEEER